MKRENAVHALEQEVGVMLRRVRRVLGVRARAVDESMQAASYLILVHVAEHGPVRASDIVEAFEIDKGAVSRQVHHLLSLGLLEGSRDPADGRATLLSATDEALTRLRTVSEHRRKQLNERLGDWSDARLEAFVAELSSYNQALSERD